MRVMTKSALRLLAVPLAVLGLLLGTAAPASAHAALVGSDPAQGSVVKTAPAQVRLTFSEGVLLSRDAIRVLGPDGERAETGDANDAGRGNTTAAVALRPGLGNGTYTVAWKAVSADSHPVAGAFTFSIGAPSKTSVALPTQEVGGGAVGTLYDIARYAAYLGFALLVGAAFFIGVCWPDGARTRPMRRLVATGWATMVAATILLLMLRAPYANGGALGDAFDLGGVRDVLDTRPGAALLSRLLLLAAGAVFIAVLFGSWAKREDPVERQDLAWGLAIGGTVVSVGLAATWAMAEHASVGIQASVAMPVDIVHLLAMAVWLGGLTALLAALWGGQRVERAAVRRFSKIAFGAVVTLVVTGVYQSWRQLGSWDALVSTGYGQLLLVKVGLVILLVELAWLSRRWTARLGETAVRGRAAAVAQPVAAGRKGAGGGGGDASERAGQLARQEAALAKERARKERDGDAERTGLRKSVLAEVAVAVVVLAVTTLLTGTQPGRAAEEGAAQQASAPVAEVPEPLDVRIPFDTGGTDGKGEAEVTMDPGGIAENELHLLVTAPDGRAFDVPEVQISFTLKSKKIGPIPVTLGKVDTGHWSAANVQIPVPGEWTIAVTVRTSDIDQVTRTKVVKIGS
ncbi:copper resistance CopC/CopD family protein [Actinacidiphila glaucinigra]|uniref:copper resistance CopC/CopD family protein n=1 Tax=Actinacidiphila glaucinigra TaxID=235986 RepID=UPI002DDC1292|nr:copper resistance protein CopC [Actinacidiphila glaucinigra]WSD61075.1 copper resistance protein CopC [Actinacidiphila glaucinigra]